MTDKNGAPCALADHSVATGQPHTKPPSVIKATTVLSGAATFAPRAAPGAHMIDPPAQASSVFGLDRSICDATDDDWLIRWFTRLVSWSMASSTHRQTHSGEIGCSLAWLLALATISSRRL